MSKTVWLVIIISMLGFAFVGMLEEPIPYHISVD
jgi:hypothetical protein